MKLILIIGIVTWHLTIFNAAQELRSHHKRWSVVERPDIQNGNSDHEESSEPKLSPVQMVARGERQFSSEYFQYAIHRTEENWVSAPLSNYLILSMIAYGAGGETRPKCFEVLKIPENESEYVKEGYKNLLAELTNYHNYSLYVENKFFMYDSNHKPAEKYSDIMTTFFKKTNSYLPRGVVEYPSDRFKDQWELLKERSASKNAIASTDIGLDPTVLLDSTLYFKAQWKTQFSKKVTVMSPFMNEGQYPVNVETMYAFGTYVWGELLDIFSTFIKLPLKTNNGKNPLSMFLILPRLEYGISTMLINTSKIDLNYLCDKGVEKNVHVYLPKFTIETSKSIKSNMKDMGLIRLFSKKSDLTGISESPKITPSEFGHSAILDVHEYGIGPVDESPPPISNNDITQSASFIPDDHTNFITFNASHPFLVLVSTTGEVRLNVLMGHYMGPEISSKQ